MTGTTASIGNFHIYRDGTEDGFYGFSPGCPFLVRQRYYGPDPIELRACIFSHDVALDFLHGSFPFLGYGTTLLHVASNRKSFLPA